jgi:hypothetical protein
LRVELAPTATRHFADHGLQDVRVGDLGSQWTAGHVAGQGCKAAVLRVIRQFLIGEIAIEHRQ